MHTHHHGLDGIQVAYGGLTPTSLLTPAHLFNVIAEYNARQGLSWVGGIGLAAINCKFNHTGAVRFSSSPGAGLDIEAEVSVCRQGYFMGCEFLNNNGCGIVADSGDSAHVVFEKCMIWGLKSWSVWPNKPYLRFKHCAIHGSMINLYNDASNLAASCRFIGCTVDDFPHARYGPPYSGGCLIDMGGSPGFGVIFDGCRVTAMHSKSFYTIHSGPQNPFIIRNTVITHGWAHPPQGDFICLMRGGNLQNVHFREAYRVKTPNQYQIIFENATIGPNVIVDGPVVTASMAPHTGKLNQGSV